MARARSLRSSSALVVRHDVEEAVRKQTRAAAPLYRQALVELRQSATLDEMDTLLRQVQKEDLEDMVDGGAVERISQHVLTASLMVGRDVAVQHVPAGLGAPARALADRLMVTERAARWAEQRAASMVVAVSDGTRESLRHAIASSIRSGMHTGETTKLMRELVPLDPRRARALENYRLRLFAEGVEDGRAARMTAAYGDRLLKSRAETIARTETFTAVNEGRADLWRELADEKVIPAEKVIRQWLTSRDERLCDDCEALDGTTAGLNDDFGGTSFPPAHPNCRCTVTIEVNL